jgi:hypothetical protein
MEVPPTSQSGLIRWWIAHPIVGFIGSLASVIGLPLAVYFYVAGQASRELTITSDPAVTIVKGGQASSVDIRYHGNPITTDVYARQIYVWNGGTDSIRTQNILEPIELIIPNASILETRLRKLTRPLTKVTVRQAGNSILLDWNILEHNDAAAVDIIYAAADAGRLQVHGAIEHQKGIKFVEYETPRKRDPTWLTVLGYLLFGGFGIFMIILGIGTFRNIRASRKSLSRSSIIGGLLIGILCLVAGCMTIVVIKNITTNTSVVPPVF